MSWFTSFPSYLWALMALAVPVIIHLLSKSKGKLVFVGTLQFFQQVKPVKMTEIKLIEALLLLLRLLMLVSAILLVAQLWFVDNTHNENNDIALISPAWLNHSSAADKQALAIILENQSAYLLDSNLKELNHRQVLAWQKPATSKETKSQNKPLWQAINTAHFSLPQQATFHIYTDNKAENFIGEPVKITQPIQWHVLENKPIVEENTVNSGLNVVIVLDKDRVYSRLRLQQAFKIIKQAVMPELTLEVIDSQALLITETSSSAAENTMLNADWLFYLSSSEPPVSVLEAIQRGVKLFFDGRTNDNIAQSLDEITTSLFSYDSHIEDALVHKRVKRSEQPSLDAWLKVNAKGGDIQSQPKLQPQALWFTDQGEIIIEKQLLPEKNAVIYQFYSRFEPSWSNVAEQPQFIHQLLSFLTSGDDALQSRLNQRLTLAQIESLETKLPNQLAAGDNTAFDKSHRLKVTLKQTLKDYNQQSLTSWLIVLLILCWCVERLLTEYSLKKQASFKRSELAK
ncbi:BatA domain-containing protein [Colwellia sp. 1_MG-2023]|uniref:BatA domain-containing protein n=1 Tax=Colwellia sp. 1_MG-2023 TaxID=3062649 RepID=UPI0026E216F9|nr:BatA domain-containing protein [Colwellia sp. 1_MG-2023]MDO6446820.1 BatA domain-containing protein [Colwellia sp. 1_MG-2023]